MLRYITCYKGSKLGSESWTSPSSNLTSLECRTVVRLNSSSGSAVLEFAVPLMITEPELTATVINKSGTSPIGANIDISSVRGRYMPPSKEPIT